MDATTAALIGTGVGTGSGITATLITVFFARRLEERKAKLARAAALETEVRARVADIGRYLLTGLHSIEWVCWHARRAPGKLDPDRLDQYQRGTHATMPQLLGGLAVVASLDQDKHDRLNRLAYQLYKSDERVALAAIRYSAFPQESAGAIAEVLPAVYQALAAWPEALAAILNSTPDQDPGNGS